MPSRFVSCPLCGQGFGSASIGIHVPQCYDKALKRWQLDPRGPKPVMPVRSSPGLGNARGSMTSKTLTGSNTSGGPLDRASPLPIRVPLSQQQQELYATPPPGAAVNRHPCKKCGRSFAFDRIQYHESVCVGSKKRKQFNAKKQRLSDFDEYELRAAAAVNGSKPMGSKGNRASLAAGRPSGAHSWRQQHQEFIEAIRNAKRYAAAASSVNNGVGGARSQVPANPHSQRRPPRQPFGVNALRNPQPVRTVPNRSIKSQEAGAGARARPQEMQFSAPQPASAQRPAARQQSTNGGGSGLGGAPRGGAWTGASPSYRIVHTNATSKAMLEAFGRV